MEIGYKENSPASNATVEPKGISEEGFYLHLSYLDQCKESTETTLWTFNVADVITNCHSGTDKMFNEVLLILSERECKQFHFLFSRELHVMIFNFSQSRFKTNWGMGRGIWFLHNQLGSCNFENK